MSNTGKPVIGESASRSDVLAQRIAGIFNSIPSVDDAEINLELQLLGLQPTGNMYSTVDGMDRRLDIVSKTQERLLVVKAVHDPRYSGLGDSLGQDIILQHIPTDVFGEHSVYKIPYAARPIRQIFLHRAFDDDYLDTLQHRARDFLVALNRGDVEFREDDIVIAPGTSESHMLRFGDDMHLMILPPILRRTPYDANASLEHTKIRKQ